MRDLEHPPEHLAGWSDPAHGLERRTARANGHQISYVTGGQGAPVVLLHGLGATSYAWRFTLPALAEHFTVIAPDQVGCGDSAKPPIEYTIELMARTVLALLDELGIPKAHFIGHSLGGGVTLRIYGLAPQRVERIALVCSGGLGRELHWLLRVSTLPGAESVLSALTNPQLGLPQASRVMERRRMRRLAVECDETAPTVIDRLREPETRRAFVSMLRSVSDLGGQKINARPLLELMQVPALVVWGARDTTIPLEHGMVAATLMPRAYLEVLPSCFHRPQIEAPEAFNALVLDFLQADAWPPAHEESETTTARYEPLIKRRRARRRWQRIAPAALAAASIPALYFGVTRGTHSRRLPYTSRKGA